MRPFKKLPPEAGTFLLGLLAAKPEDLDDTYRYQYWQPELPLAPEVLAALLEYPITRLLYLWRGWDRSGLSPFALAGLTRHSPGEVLAQMELEPYVSTISYCGDTMLPIVFSSDLSPDKLYRRTRPRVFNNYNESFDETWEASDLDWPNEEWHPGLRKLKVGDFFADPFASLLKVFGGPGWRKHCTASFDPFATDCELQPREWKALREMYLGRTLKPREL